MGATIGYVQRGYDGRYNGTLVKNPGVLLGPFSGAGLAQKAVNGSVGKSLRWTLENAETEKYRGDDPAWWPADFGAALVFWLEASRGIVTPDQTTDLVRRWNSIDGERVYSASAAAADAPTLVAVADQSRPTVRFPTGDTTRLTSNFATLEAPFTVVIAARYNRELSVAKRVAFNSSLLRLQVDTAGDQWELFSNTTVVVGPAPSGAVDVVAATVTATASTGYVNGVSSFGSTVDVPVGAIGAIELSRAASDWDGDIAEVVIVDRALNTLDLTKLVNYLRLKYQGGVL